MKRTLFVIVLGTSLLALGSFNLFQGASASLTRLGIPEDQAKDFVWWSFSGGVFSYPGGAKVKGTPASERAGVVRDICAYAKQYSESDAFRQRYLEDREQRKPVPPGKPESMEAMRKRMKKELEQSIKEFKENIRSLAADQQEMMKPALASMEEQLKSYDDPDNPMFSKEMESAVRQGYESQMAEYKERLAEWEKTPTDPRFMIELWLRKFMEESKDIDFNAKLAEDANGKMRFVRNEYEMKSANWKLCYRAGRESVEAARAFVKGWLGELEKKH
jgi:hypothetical protein